MFTSSKLDRNLQPASFVTFQVYTSVLTNLESNPSQAATEGQRHADKRETDSREMGMLESHRRWGGGWGQGGIRIF